MWMLIVMVCMESSCKLEVVSVHKTTEECKAALLEVEMKDGMAALCKQAEEEQT